MIICSKQEGSYLHIVWVMPMAPSCDPIISCGIEIENSGAILPEISGSRSMLVCFVRAWQKVLLTHTAR